MVSSFSLGNTDELVAHHRLGERLSGRHGCSSGLRNADRWERVNSVGADRVS